MKTSSLRVSGPYPFENLSLFLLHGQDQIPAGSYAVLQKAMERKEAVVHETGNVGELLIENLGDQDLFIQSGEIVKGGRQDRVLGVDLIVGKKSGRVPIPSFCVERSRWSKRGQESQANFSSSPHYLASKSIKKSAKMDADQSQVWDSISLEQTKLGAAVRGAVTSKLSPTSYQLTLENEKIQKRIKSGLDELQPLIDKNSDSVGFVFSVNGELNSAEAYANHDLFTQLWEKLLTAAITEAVSESKPATATKSPEPTPSEIEKFLKHKEGDLTEDRVINDRARLRVFSSAKKAIFETADVNHNLVCVHMNALSSN